MMHDAENIYNLCCLWTRFFLAMCAYCPLVIKIQIAIKISVNITKG